MRPRGFGFVRFVDKDDMECCLKECGDGIEVEGVECKVEFTKPRVVAGGYRRKTPPFV